MRRIIRFITLSIVALSFCTLAAPSRGTWAEPTKDQLKEQFKSRETDLRDMKKRGQVGETIDGYVEAVDASSADDAMTKLISDENKDRRALYQIIADEINKENPKAATKATMDTIAARNALRNIEHAQGDEYLRVAKNHWIHVKDFANYQKLQRYKTQGKVGETGAGLVEIVQAADKADKTLSAFVDEENARRNAEYRSLADKEHVDAPIIAKRMGSRNLENARIGDMIKEDGGSWRKK